MRTEELTKEFARAGLDARPMKRPMFMGPDAQRAFFLTVRRGRNKVWYEFWPGREENVVQVLNADPELRQLVLMVKEPGGKFTVKEYDYKLRKAVDRTHTISPQTRRFLVGFDERDLFMAQLPAAARITTVRQAHDVLFPTALRTPAVSKVSRQGEWFFTPVTADERKLIKKHHLSIAKKTRIQPSVRQGNPHTADEYLEIPIAPDRKETVPSAWGGRPRTRVIQGERSMFIRGKIRHRDHETVEFTDWHRVYRNTEDRGANAKWID